MIDFVYREGINKVAGFIGYGIAGGTRVVEQLRLVMGEWQVVDVRSRMNAFEGCYPKEM